MATQKLKKIFKIDDHMLNRKLLTKEQESMDSFQERNYEWNNDLIQRFPMTWYDPWRQDESIILYYVLALPVGFVGDLFFYTCRGRSKPQPEINKSKFVNNRLYKDKELSGKFLPFTNTRYLARWKVVLSWTVLLLLGLFMILGVFTVVKVLAESSEN